MKLRRIIYCLFSVIIFFPLISGLSSKDVSAGYSEEIPYGTYYIEYAGSSNRQCYCLGIDDTVTSTNRTHYAENNVSMNVELQALSFGSLYKTTNQMWHIFPSEEEGYYYIRNIKNPSKEVYLSIENGEARDGVNIKVCNRNWTDAQKFRFNRNSNGTFTIVSKLENEDYAVDVYGAICEEGSNITLWHDDKNEQDPALQFCLRPADYNTALETGSKTVGYSAKTKCLTAIYPSPDDLTHAYRVLERGYSFVVTGVDSSGYFCTVGLTDGNTGYVMRSTITLTNYVFDRI